MSHVTTNQPEGTATWVDLGVPDLDRAMALYGSLFGWGVEVGPAETAHSTLCLRDGRRPAGLIQNPRPEPTYWWSVSLGADDCDAAFARSAAAGGIVVMEPMDSADQGRMAMILDPVGAQFGLWQGRLHVGCEI